MKILKALGGVLLILVLLAIFIIVGILAIAGTYILWFICVGAFTLGILMFFFQSVWDLRPRWLRRSSR